MIDAIYYDGQNSRRHLVTLVIQKRVVAMRGVGVRRNERLSKMDVSERLQHAPRILRFPDGAFIEASDHRRLDRMLKENRFQDPRVVRWQNNWPLSLLALVCLLGALLSAYQWGLPAGAEAIASRLPPSFGKKVGDQGFAVMEEKLLAPSKLPMPVQQHLRERFAALRQPRGEKTPYRLEFRSGKMGANAFALPNGVIVITDAMVRSTDNEDALLGVLSHELGHLQRRHSARQLLQSAGVGIILNLWAGDVSTALAAVPAILVNLKHSRDFEREADKYAIDMMLVNGLPLEPMAVLFESMSHKPAADADEKDDEDDEDDRDDEDAPPSPPSRRGEAPPDYLSSHPADAERIATLRAADLRARGTQAKP
jgi:Zn-dependent protease with chaperone function